MTACGNSNTSGKTQAVLMLENVVTWTLDTECGEHYFSGFDLNDALIGNRLPISDFYLVDPRLPQVILDIYHIGMSVVPNPHQIDLLRHIPNTTGALGFWQVQGSVHRLPGQHLRNVLAFWASNQCILPAPAFGPELRARIGSPTIQVAQWHSVQTNTAYSTVKLEFWGLPLICIPGTQITYSLVKNWVSSHLDVAWLNHHYPFWQQRLLLAQAMGVPPATQSEWIFTPKLVPCKSGLSELVMFD